MLSLFPQLLFLAPFSTTLLRVSAGIVILLVAWIHVSKREELSHIDFFVIGRGPWIPIVAAILEFAIAAALIAGIYAQLAALLGALAALKSLIWKSRFGGFFPLPQSTSALLFVICLSLVFSGAGIFAFDLPL